MLIPELFTCRSGRTIKKAFIRLDDLRMEKRDDLRDVAREIGRAIDWKGTPSREHIGQHANVGEIVRFIKERIAEEDLLGAPVKQPQEELDPVWEPEPEPVAHTIDPLGPVSGRNGHSSVAAGNDGLAAFGTLIAPYIPRPDIDLVEVRQRVNTELDAMGAKVDTMRQELSEHFEKLISELPARRIEIVTPSQEVIDVTEEHELFSVIYRLLDLRCHVWLVGPAGSGKTTLVERIAAKLGLEYSAESVCAQTTKSDLKGFINANGVYVPSELYKRYTTGGIMLLDEFDYGNANTSNVLNALLANDVCAFPTGMEHKHANFIAIAASNTFGTGQTRTYVGANQMNEATRDRFCFVEFPYDESLEERICGATVKARKSSNPFLAPGTSIDVDGWLKVVRQYRQNAETTKSRIVVSPRASKVGAKLVQCGFSREQVEEMLIFRGCDDLTKAKLKGVAQ